MDHTIQGKWATRELWIDGQQITVDMVERELQRRLEPPQPFTWGISEGRISVSTRLVIDAIHLYVDSPALRDGFKILDSFFFDELTRLPQTDFALMYSDGFLQQKLHEILNE